MRFLPVSIAGARVLELDRIEDERGFFARSWCAEEFVAQGLDDRLVQCNVSYNRRRGTLRGLHYQEAPFAEAKLVRCTQGALFDVIVDVRPASPTYLRWEGFELSSANRRQLYIPQGVAHGFQTLTDDTEVFYQMSAPHVASAARGVRWDDPVVGVRWPVSDPVVSERDRSYPWIRA